MPAGRGERDPQRFWLSVLGALRQTGPGSVLVQPVTAAPDLDGGAITERLLTDLAPLDDRVWLVVDDVHELGPEALRQLELLIMRAPPGLRFVLATRHDVRLGLHRLRLEGELAEIREPDLRFTVAEAGELFAAAGVELPELALLVERTEGWAAGLRLAALSLAGHPDPERLAAEFSGTERTVAEYLLAEVLDRQGEPGAATAAAHLDPGAGQRGAGRPADRGLGRGAGAAGPGGRERIHDARSTRHGPGSATTTCSPTCCSWNCAAPNPTRSPGCTGPPPGGSPRTGTPVEAVRHAQAARDWSLAARLLADHWPGLHLDGQDATVHELLAGFPPEARAADAELATLAAGDELGPGVAGGGRAVPETGRASIGVGAGRPDRAVPDPARHSPAAVRAPAREPAGGGRGGAAAAGRGRGAGGGTA